MPGYTGDVLVGYWDSYESEVLSSVEELDCVTSVEKLGFCTLLVGVSDDVCLQNIRNVDYVNHVEREEYSQQLRS